MYIGMFICRIGSSSNRVCVPIWTAVSAFLCSKILDQPTRTNGNKGKQGSVLQKIVILGPEP